MPQIHNPGNLISLAVSSLALELRSFWKNKYETSQPSYNVIRFHLPFNKSESYWWDTTAVILSKLMFQADYPLFLHYERLSYFYDIVLPAWGPILLNTDGQPDCRAWKPTMLADDSSCKPRVNLRTTGTTETAIRCDDPTIMAVELLPTFYKVVLNIKDGEKDKALTAYHPGWGSVLFNCTFRSGAAIPTPQFYIQPGCFFAK
ncbi:hypothetical protein BGW36DRAFT_379777 [Talaromyces proteolyticus]|uniref:Uncharacterized protein n=1 Tax=Talaromyces proteolyticus TaxID=1131652 RepID=A0AAD4KVY0_9EURO|nr:uncharacterized protein BGW36DRAFT_379777 [Talaromyces proteolyticus]KAH8697975.1 hypothetical protein BGW36DRAFT_379777 [Talaromyces proteolyticus]